MGALQITKNRVPHSWWPPWTVLTAVASLLLVHLANSTITCGPGIKSAGGTVPRGDIVLEHGSGAPLEITCLLDPDNEMVVWLSRVRGPDGGTSTTWPSRRITFYRNSERVAARHVAVLNETAARLRVPDPPAGQYTYVCMLRVAEERRPQQPDGLDGVDDAVLRSDENTLFSTAQPTSLETSGPPPLVPPDQEIGVCMNSVFVGYKPFNITNINCISNNWDNLTCTWIKPENPIKTKYRVSFKLSGRPGGRSVSVCPTDSDITKNTCFWDLSTSPLYRQTYEQYYFTLFGENALGNSTSVIRFNHYANVIPASPINIIVLDKTPSSAMLRWSTTMSVFPRPLIHKIEYKSQWDSNPEHWHSVNVCEICNSSLASNHNSSSSDLNCLERNHEYYTFNVTDLKYAFTHYDFRIYVRSSVARGEDKWSAPGCITLKTKPTIPRRPPRTDIGSFESVTSSADKSTRDVFIYWQNIDDYEKCGDLFEYRVFYTSLTSDNKTIAHYSNETYKNYAKFDGLSTSVGYNFTVYSANTEGLSTEYSTVYVPSESDKLSEPLSFTKMAFDERGVFELSWKNASNNPKISAGDQLDDYTIFWCENDKDRPYQCNGYMNWMHIPSSESCYNITVSDHLKIYQFAISANRKSLMKTDFLSLYQPTTSSSGMVWASCTVLHNKIVGKMKNVWVNVIASTFMELRWKLDCSDRIGAVLGFQIFYCPVVSINNSACKEPMLNKTVNGEMAQDSRGLALITDLKPYTTYMVKIALITKHGEGLHSDPLLNTTMEGYPDVQAIKLTATNYTNTSVSLQWTPPKFPNGVVRNYFVHYHLDDVSQQQRDLIDSLDEQQPSNHKSVVKVYDTKCRLDNLESYRKYHISVSACTTVCSNHTNPIEVQTAVGLPGRVAQPNLLYENTTRIFVSWPKPAKPAGPVDYYQLIVAHHSGPTNSQSTNALGPSPPAAAALASTQLENPDNFVYQSASNEYRVPVPDCNSEHEKGQQTFSFSVRAVNNNPNDPSKPFFGPWSVPGSVSCVLPGFPLILHLVIWSCLFIVLTTVSTYWGKRLWRKYKIMSNVEIILPPALDVRFERDRFHDFDDNSVDSYEEIGHLVYVVAPAADGVVNNAADANVSSDLTNNCPSTGSTGSTDRLPSSRWSPTAAATTTDNDFSSHKPQTVQVQVVTTVPSPPPPPPPPPPSSPPKKKKESTGSVNSDDDADEEEVAECVTPTEPVLPYFTMPDAPTEPVLPYFTMPDTPPLAVKPYYGTTVGQDRGGHPDVGDGHLPDVGGGHLPDVGGGHLPDVGGGHLPDDDMVMVVNSVYHHVPKQSDRLSPRPDGGGVVAVGGGRIVTTTPPVIDCFAGDQPQSRYVKNVNKVPRRRVGGAGSRRESPSREDDPKTTSFLGDVDRVQNNNNNTNDDDDGGQLLPVRRDEQEDEPSPANRLNNHEQHKNDGYCSIELLIAAAAEPSPPPQQQQQQQQQQPPAVSVSPYVMLDMVTGQKRLLDVGRSECGKPAADDDDAATTTTAA